MTNVVRACTAVMLLLMPAMVWAQAAAPAQPALPLARQGVPPAKADGVEVPIEPKGFDYDPGGRRDPFVSLLRRGADASRSASAIHPAGLAGLEAAEVTLKGTLQGRDGYVAMLQGSDGRTYIVRVGDRLFDGTIRSISQNVLVIVQPVNDPLSLEKQRDVRKTIRQNNEAK